MAATAHASGGAGVSAGARAGCPCCKPEGAGASANECGKRDTHFMTAKVLLRKKARERRDTRGAGVQRFARLTPSLCWGAAADEIDDKEPG